ncbi:exodeoxyribonuclease VII small subunit [Alkalicoccus halolimnae]|uniref:Exodeoxyribonuclease 7 small subunit n=1 Tax=Alkalicoccus halolimnae TaxID=1667239 RepID=A0A5C7FJA1_9BACI|nr:exodeoxyribonuclease VII small subunit [Alkalicoccus halolimnae]TXF86364.1 exodeoxyribonuclease VII small subunit [Alkalicoccus halolimnae]
MSEEKTNPSFENSMRELEEIVQKLEQGDVPLEEAIEMFQEGMKLSKDCHERLQKVEKQMTEVLSEDGTLSTLPEEDL